MQITAVLTLSPLLAEYWLIDWLLIAMHIGLLLLLLAFDCSHCPPCLQVIEDLPVQLLLNYLGQGYK